MRQQLESASIYHADPYVQLGAEMGPKLAAAQAEVDARLPEPVEEISPDQLTPAERAKYDAAQGASQSFQRFFDGSKVLDAQGNPLTLYHGTAADFERFDNARLGEATGHMTAPLGHFLAEDRAKAAHYAEQASEGVAAHARVLKLHVAMRHPKEMSLQDLMDVDSQADARAIKAKLEQAGYDGIHVPEIGQWIAFDAKQIRDASTRPPSAPKAAAPARAAAAKQPEAPTLAPENEAALRQLEAKHGHETIETADGERMTVAELGQRMRNEAGLAESNDKLLDAAVACFARTGGAL
jgi:hypothetical protein